MSSMTISNPDPAMKERLGIRAVEHGHPMEAQARRIPRTTLEGRVLATASKLHERIREPLRDSTDRWTRAGVR